MKEPHYILYIKRAGFVNKEYLTEKETLSNDVEQARVFSENEADKFIEKTFKKYTKKKITKKIIESRIRTLKAEKKKIQQQLNINDIKTGLSKLLLNYV